ncbi:MAG: hypothetical protein JW832_06715 [Deltaproteobacteria bacterium]|nr:hypothetical protein [Deltaproteobacteria bacterium]
MSYQTPASLEEFQKSYAAAVRSFIRAKNKTATLKLDPDDFVQDVLVKFIEEKTLEKYDPARGASFKTFLSRVLYYFYLTKFETVKRDSMSAKAVSEYRAGRRAKLGEIQEANDTDEDDDDPHLEDETGKQPVSRQKKTKTTAGIDPRDVSLVSAWAAPADARAGEKPAVNVRLIFDLINRVPVLEERLLLKLKLYTADMSFSQEETGYLARRLGTSSGHVELELRKIFAAKPGSAIGVKNEDIVKLLPYAPGSISTMFLRLVKKHIRDQYIALEG